MTGTRKKQPVCEKNGCKWLFPTISYVQIWFIIFETTMYKWMFQVPGIFCIFCSSSPKKKGDTKVLAFEGLGVEVVPPPRFLERNLEFFLERIFTPKSALICCIYYTLPETNIAPENRPLEKEIPTGNQHV